MDSVITDAIKQYQEFYQHVVSSFSCAGPTDRKEPLRKLKKMESELQSAVAFKKDTILLLDDLLKPVLLAEIKTIIHSLLDDRSANIVLPRTAVLYYPESSDITQELISRTKKKKSLTTLKKTTLALLNEHLANTNITARLNYYKRVLNRIATETLH